MDIQQAIAPASPPPKAVDKTPVADRNDAAAERGNGQTDVSAFSSLLQGLQQTVEEVAALPQSDEATLASEMAVTEPLAMPLRVEDLLGQAQRLDTPSAPGGQEVHAANARPESPVPNGGARPHIAVGQHVATVAAGVQPAPNTVAAIEAPPVTATATAVLAQAVEASGAVEQAVTVDADRDVMPEGRMALEGAWTLDDAKAELSPALQRVMTQVEQWAAASAGATVRPGPRAETARSTAAAGVEALVGGQGSGTQLTDNAVREVQQAQNAMFEAQHDVPVEDMRFWLQGRQQRAEVVLEKDGQPVRVQVAVRGNEAHVVFSADQAHTRELLDGHVEQLRSMLAQQGLELSSLQVQAEAQGQASGQQEASRGPWSASPVRYGQVQVPVEQAPAPRPSRSQGLDLYA